MLVKTCLNRTLTYRNIGANRSEMMGLSIMLIMLYHCGVIKLGDIGVDFFLFISGFSMYHSLIKDDNTWSFYIKRADRILPLYLIVAVPYFIYDSSSVIQFFLRITNIAVLTEGYLNGWWFISAICFCYVLTPILYSQIRKNGKYKYLLVGLVSSVCYTCGFFFVNSSIMMYRIPDFLLGLLVADNLNNRDTIGNNRMQLVLIAILGIVFFLLQYTNNILLQNRWVLYSFLVFPLVFMSSNVFQCASCKIKRIFSYLGTITLELYLLHEYFAIPMARTLLFSYSGGGNFCDFKDSSIYNYSNIYGYMLALDN